MTCRRKGPGLRERDAPDYAVRFARGEECGGEETEEYMHGVELCSKCGRILEKYAGSPETEKALAVIARLRAKG